jgi:glycine dehydrogenase subunit 1
MSYISLSKKDKQEMLAKIGISSLDELFDSIPDGVKLKRDLNVPAALSEPELLSHFESVASRNEYSHFLSFLGAGAYSHYIPAVVDYLSSRGEFVSPYTPYQPEVSQGTLHIIFEFQTLICQLTGMDIANASLYDGASGAAEAVLMANRLNHRTRVLVSRTLHPQYRETIRTYTRNLGIAVEEIGYTQQGGLDLAEIEKQCDESTAAVVYQSPNFFGVIEDIRAISEISHKHKALSVAVVAEPLSLGLLEAPGKLGADVVTGEAQSFGLNLSFGGPYLGFIACAQAFIRQLPGRIAGQTRDIDGERGFVLTLSTREQHIRRERATSNICTNQALCLLRATIYLETLGKKGLHELAGHNVQKANYAKELVSKIKGIRTKFSDAVFNEFVLELEKPWDKVEAKLKEQGLIGGLGLGRFYPELEKCALVCVTEMHSKGDIDRLANALEGTLES